MPKVTRIIVVLLQDLNESIKNLDTSLNFVNQGQDHIDPKFNEID